MKGTTKSLDIVMLIGLVNGQMLYYRILFFPGNIISWKSKKQNVVLEKQETKCCFGKARNKMLLPDQLLKLI